MEIARWTPRGQPVVHSCSIPWFKRELFRLGEFFPAGLGLPEELEGAIILLIVQVIKARIGTELRARPSSRKAA